MNNATTSHRLEGLEPDNLLAFLALLGLLKALEVFDQEAEDIYRLRPRAGWDLHLPPVRPRIYLSQVLTGDEMAARAALGIEALSRVHDFDGRKDLNHTRSDCRDLLDKAARTASVKDRQKVDLLAALMSDGAVKLNKKEEVIDPTPLCLLFGQGHQHFLERLANVPNQDVPPPKGRRAKPMSAAECLTQTLFQPWRREDDTFSFRWDPAEDVRYALMAGDPTDSAYKTGTQHGANRLAAIGLSALTVAPQRRNGRVRANVIGGAFDREGFSFAWPIWRDPATLSAIRCMLAHPNLRGEAALANISVDHVLVARRISVGKFMNFSRGRRVFAREREEREGSRKPQ